MRPPGGPVTGPRPVAESGAGGQIPPLPHPFGDPMLYVGPDQLMPLTSIFGAIGGALLIFWRQLRALARRIFRRDSE